MSCPTCGENRFENSAQRSCHMSKNHAELFCGCGKRFMTLDLQEKHAKYMRDNAKQCPCAKCCRSFKCDQDLIQHKRSLDHWEPGERDRVQITTNKVFCNDKCGKSFKSMSALADHRRDVLANLGITDKTCLSCVKTFPTKDRLDQHQKDTKHSGKTTSRVKEHIDNFYKSNLAINPAEKRAALKLATDTHRAILDRVRQTDGGKFYSADIYHAGSFPMKTKIGKADEFDTNIVCRVKDPNVLTRGHVNYVYELPDKTKGKANNMNVSMILHDLPNGKAIPIGHAVVGVTDRGGIPSHLIHDGHVIPREVRKDLHQRYQQAIKDLKLKDVYLNKHTHGPALTFTITPPGDHKISVDVTAVVPCSGSISDDGWPRPGTRKAFSQDVIEKVKGAGIHVVPKGEECWLKSYSKAEKTLFVNLDGDNGCRREVNKFLKKYVQDCTAKSSHGLPGMSSHPLKHSVLWACEKHSTEGYWHQNNIHNCLIDTMGDLCTALDTGKLPNYFNTSENILKGKDPQVLRELSSYIKQERTKLLHL